MENCAVEANSYQGNTASSFMKALLGRIEGSKIVKKLIAIFSSFQKLSFSALAKLLEKILAFHV